MTVVSSYFGDAYAAYGPDGTAFCAFNGGPKGDRLDLWILRSDNGGRRWLGPTVLSNRVLDYARLAVDVVSDKPRVFVAVATYGDQPIFAKSRRSGYGCAILRSAMAPDRSPPSIPSRRRRSITTR